MPATAEQPKRLDHLWERFDKIAPAEMRPVMEETHAEIVQESIWRKGVEPMPFDEFVKTVSGVHLTPRQRQAFEKSGLMTARQIVAQDRSLQALVLMYGKGSGKDIVAAWFISYLSYIVCELTGDPSVFFGLAPFSQLSIMNVAPSEDLARQVFFRYLTQNLKSRIFDEYAPTILADEARFFRKNPEDGKPYLFMALLSKHSNSSGLDGYNLLAWVMDEADAFLDSAQRSIADTVHNILRSSCNTRLKNRWVGMVISYPRVEGGFMMRLYDRACKEMAAMGDKSSFYADRAATWEVRPDVSREDPGIRADYENDPVSAAALYETIPALTIDAFFEYPEKIDDAVDAARTPCAYVTTEMLDLPTDSGKAGHYITALLGHVVRTPGHAYFLGGDAGVHGDAYALSIFHVDETSDALGYLCPRCGTPENRTFAPYSCQPGMSRVPYNEAIYCGHCSATPFEFFEMAVVPGGTMRLDGWWVRSDIANAKADGGGVISNGRGSTFDVPHVYEDLLVRVKPIRATRPGEVNRPVFFPAIRTLCQGLIEGLGIRQARFDKWNTAEITQGLLQATGADVAEISFAMPEQYRRARLVKSMLYAAKVTLLPDAGRDKEWKRLQRQNGNRIDHPKQDGQKDCWDAESVAIWCAATSQCSNLEATWI